jgi:hypothetical protein
VPRNTNLIPSMPIRKLRAAMMKTTSKLDMLDTVRLAWKVSRVHPLLHGPELGSCLG